MLVNYIEQEQIINSAWIDIKGFMKLVPICESRAKKEFKKIKDEMRLNDEMYFETRPVLIPTKKIIDKFKIPVKVIREEARRIKGVKLND